MKESSKVKEDERRSERSCLACEAKAIRSPRGRQGENVGDALGQEIIFGKNIDYQTILGEYKKHYSDKHAKNIAVFEMMKREGIDALKDVALEPAQRAFYDSLQKSMRRNK